MSIKIPIVSQFDGSGIKKAAASFKQLETAGQKMSFALKVGAAGVAAGLTAVGTAAYQAGQMLLDYAKMAAEDQKSQLQLATSIRASTKATDEQIAATETWIDMVARATGIADDELRPAYARLVRSTHSLKKANDLLRTALNVSAGTGKDLMTVVNALSRASDGSTVALNKLGLGYDKAYLKATPFAKVVADLNKRFEGAALANAGTYAGAMGRFSVAMDELKESLGYVVLPALTKLANIGANIAGAFGRDGAAGAFAEFKFQLKTLLYDANGQLNQVGKTLNDLSSKFNLISKIGGFIASSGTLGIGNRLSGALGGPSLSGPRAPTFAPSVDPTQFRTIRNAQSSGVNVYIQTGIGDPVAIGRQVYNRLQALERRGGR